jgi:uncharacterized protein involved in exopolysaccharide biosynthesis
MEWAFVGNYVLLVLHSIRRHRVLFAGVWIAVVGASLGLASALPRTWDIDTAIEVSPTNVISDLSTGKARGGEAPAKWAESTVVRHENLVALVHQTRLLEEWPKTRHGLAAVKDGVMSRLFPAPSEEERVEAFVGLLEKQFWVDTDESVVTIGIHFPDPRLGYLLVDTALHNFLEARQVVELSSIEDSIDILDNRTEEARQKLDEALKSLDKVRQARQAGSRAQAPTGVGSMSRLDERPDQRPEKASSRLLLQVEAKRRAISDLEEARRRRISDLEKQLAELRVTYSEAHPNVVELRDELRTAQAESPQLKELRTQLQPLETELKQRGLLPEVALKASRTRDAAVTAAALEPLDPREDLDPEIDYAKARVRYALVRYNKMLDRTDAARLELDSAQAAFKYRYSILRPPQRPRAPVKPKQSAILVASILAGLLLATIGPAMIDLGSKRVVERWQVEQLLGLPVVGEVRDG